MTENKKNLMLMSIKSRSISFSSGHSSVTSIDFGDDGAICLNTRDGKELLFNINNKPCFKNDTGEVVVELSGLATDKVEEKSWVIAGFSIGGSSTRHYHSGRTEIYYVISGRAKLIIDEKEYNLTAGDSITIHPMQKHQIFNTSQKENLVIIDECTPSWIVEDHLLDDNMPE